MRRAHTIEVSSVAKHSKEPITEPPSPRRIFMRHSLAIWLTLLLVLVVIGVVVYNDWDAPLRILSPSPAHYSVNYNSLQEPVRVYDDGTRLIYFMLYSFIPSYIALAAYAAERSRYERLELCMRIASLANHEAPMLAEDFLDMRSRLVASRMLQESEFTGVYILHNASRDKYYVGQSIRVLSRITQHLTGHGNGDVYADFKYGDRFTVRTIPIQGSGYQSLNDLERDTISAYNAKEQGYNMTRGNRR